jgi:hypothetical protein
MMMHSEFDVTAKLCYLIIDTRMPMLCLQMLSDHRSAHAHVNLPDTYV